MRLRIILLLLASCFFSLSDVSARGTVLRDCVVEGRCCITLVARDSHRESNRLDRRHEQAITRPLPHYELVRLHRLTEEAWVFADLAGQGDDLARAA